MLVADGNQKSVEGPRGGVLEDPETQRPLRMRLSPLQELLVRTHVRLHYTGVILIVGLAPGTKYVKFNCIHYTFDTEEERRLVVF